MFDIKSFYEADSVEDAIAALTADPQSQVISGGRMCSYASGRERMQAGVWYPSTISRS